MWAYAPKIVEIGNFWYKFAHKRYTPLSDFLPNLAWDGVPGSHPDTKFHHCGFKNVGLQPPKSPKLVFFWYKFAQKGYTALSDFYKM